MSKDLQELINAVSRRVGRHTETVSANDIDNNNLSQSQQHVQDVINDEIELALAEHPWLRTRTYEKDFNTSQGQSVYEITGTAGEKPDWRYIKRLYNKDQSTVLDFWGNDTFAREKVSTTNQSEPTRWRVFGVKSNDNPEIELYPVPDTNYTIQVDYHARFERLTASSDQSPINDQIVIWGSVASLLDYDSEQFDLATARYDRLIERQKQRSNNFPDLAYGEGHRSRRRSRPQMPSEFGENPFG